MKKIFVYVGSRAGRESSTFSFVRAVLNKTIESVGKENITVDLYTASSCKINNWVNSKGK